MWWIPALVVGGLYGAKELLDEWQETTNPTQGGSNTTLLLTIAALAAVGIGAYYLLKGK